MVQNRRVVVVLVCFVAGVLVARAVPSARSAAPWFDRAVLWVALPALILVKLPALELGVDAAVPVAAAWGSLGVAAAVVWAGGRLGGWDRTTVGALLLVTPLGNTSFLGFAAVGALLGDDHLPAAIAYDQLGSFLALVTWGSLVAERFGGDGVGAGRSADLGSVVRRIVTFPPFAALCLSVPLRWVELAGGAERALAAVGGLVGPLAMVAIGLRFRLRVERRVLPPAALCVATRLLLLPAIVLGVAAAAGGGTSWEAATLESAMPPMVTAGIVATAAGLDDDLVATVVGWGLLASFVTLPAWAVLIR